MASRQEAAAKDLEEVHRESEPDLGAAAAEQERLQQEQQKHGVIGSVLRAVQDTYENAKEAVVGKNKDPADSRTTTEVVHHVNVDDDDVGPGEVRDISANKFPAAIYDSATDNKPGSKAGEYADYASQKAKETKDATKQKAGEYTDYASQKAKETRDATKQKAGEYTDYASQKAKEGKDKTVEKGGEYKDYAAEKAKEGKDATVNKLGEYKDYTAEKTKEGKDTTMGKLGELKDSAADAAKRAVGYLSGKAADTTEATKNKTAETAEATKNKTAQTTEAAKNKTAQTTEAAKNKAVEVKDAAKDKAAETTQAAKQKPAEAKENTKENVSGADEGARRKMEDLRLQGKGHGDASEGLGDKVVMKVEERRPGAGAGAEALKEADQTFNDVGRLDEEGVVNVERRNK